MIRQRLLFSFNQVVFLLLANLALASAFCPSFMRNQTACSCEEYVDGAIIKCNGPKGPLVVESLKKLNIDVRELVLENANIIEVHTLDSLCLQTIISSLKDWSARLCWDAHQKVGAG